MKKILILGALAAAGLFVSQASHAQSYYSGAWCAKSNVGGGAQTERCDFATFRSCQTYITGESKAFFVQSQYVTPRTSVIVVPEYRVYRRYY